MVNQNQRELPPSGPTGDSGDEPGFGGELPNDPAAEDAPIGIRVGRNPANVGDEVADRGDVTFPEPAPRTAEI